MGKGFDLSPSDRPRLPVMRKHPKSFGSQHRRGKKTDLGARLLCDDKGTRRAAMRVTMLSDYPRTGAMLRL